MLCFYGSVLPTVKITDREPSEDKVDDYSSSRCKDGQMSPPNRPEIGPAMWTTTDTEGRGKRSKTHIMYIRGYDLVDVIRNLWNSPKRRAQTGF